MAVVNISDKGDEYANLLLLVVENMGHEGYTSAAGWWWYLHPFEWFIENSENIIKNRFDMVIFEIISTIIIISLWILCINNNAITLIIIVISIFHFFK